MVDIQPTPPSSNIDIIPYVEYTPENIANKETSALDTSTTKYPCNNVVKTALDLKATDTSVVHIAGTETITGAKTFSSVITAPSISSSPTKAFTKSFMEVYTILSTGIFSKRVSTSCPMGLNKNDWPIQPTRAIRKKVTTSPAPGICTPMIEWRRLRKGSSRKLNSQ